MENYSFFIHKNNLKFMTSLEQKIILNSYDVFPIEYSEGTDIHSIERTAYIKGGLDAVKMYEGGLDEASVVPPTDIPPTPDTTGEDNERQSKLF